MGGGGGGGGMWSLPPEPSLEALTSLDRPRCPKRALRAAGRGD